jgi:uncharacterized protein YfaA (DUF2138 family)
VKSYVVFKAELHQYGGGFFWQRVGACGSRADAAQLAALLLLDPAIEGLWVREVEAGQAQVPNVEAPNA